jgi:hypothetical protein
MKVKALKSFGGSMYGHYPEGAIFELPAGVDWLKAGLVEEVKEPKPAPKKRVARKVK